ncbi:MAG: RDD family protein, partial [Alphaproteobacteria bacterium]
ARSFTGTLGVTFGWSGIYFTLFAGLLNGRTPGKFLWRIRAVKINGQPFTFMDGFVRQGGYIAGIAMGMLGFAKVLWEPNRQAVQDRIAATVVVEV